MRASVDHFSRLGGARRLTVGGDVVGGEVEVVMVVVQVVVVVVRVVVMVEAVVVPERHGGQVLHGQRVSRLCHGAGKVSQSMPRLLAAGVSSVMSGKGRGAAVEAQRANHEQGRGAGL